MDRKSQLANVAFGGAWSEQIPGRERRATAVALIDGAAARSEEEDLREDTDLAGAVRAVCAAHPKGAELRASWERALSIPDPAIRMQEICRLARALRAWSSPTA